MLWNFCPPRKTLGLFYHEREVYRYDTAKYSPSWMLVRNLLMQNNFLMKQLLFAVNEPRNSVKLVFTMNFHVRFKSTSEFHPDRKAYSFFNIHSWFSIVYCHVKCKKYLISPPSTEVLTTFRSSAETHIWSQNVLFLPIPQSPFHQNVLSAIYGRDMQRSGSKWPVKCCLKSLLELFKWD